MVWYEGGKDLPPLPSVGGKSYLIAFLRAAPTKIATRGGWLALEHTFGTIFASSSKNKSNNSTFAAGESRFA